MRLRTIIAGGLGILFAAFLLFVGIFIPSPTGFLIAAPKKPISCDVPNFAARSGTIDSTVSGGVFTGPSFKLPATLNLEIRSDLYIVATGDLRVHGTIVLARRNPSGEIINPSANITLASLKGNVIIDGAAFIGWEQGTPLPIADRVVSSGNPVHAGLATGRIGRNGGQIRILAPMGTVSNKAEIVGFPGEEGGEAEDDTGKYGFANGVGAGGGHGGDIVICHKDGFENDAKIRAGNGGMGGRGLVNASQYMAESLGGPGGDGGNVLVRGTAAPSRSSVVNSGIFAGGLGGTGGDARTYAQNFWPITVTAVGAYGGKGGTVIFKDVELDPVGEVSNAVGGGGGWADAVAGNGPVTWGIGIRGGSAEAFGGNAGKESYD